MSRTTGEQVDDGAVGEDGVGVDGADVDAGAGQDVEHQDALVDFGQEFGRQVHQNAAVQHALDEFLLKKNKQTKQKNEKIKNNDSHPKMSVDVY